MAHRTRRGRMRRGHIPTTDKQPVTQDRAHTDPQHQRDQDRKRGSKEVSLRLPYTPPIPSPEPADNGRLPSSGKGEEGVS